MPKNKNFNPRQDEIPGIAERENKTIDQEKRFTLFNLKNMHDKLLDADLSIKRGNMTEKATLDVLVTQLCSK